jgi:hypothetical protein
MGITLTLDGIRCFSTPQTANVRPLTVLVGENSSGKTTFLAASRVTAHVLGDSARALDFNEAPFVLGTFEQIVSRGNRRAAMPDEFRLTVRQSEQEAIAISFGRNGGHPTVSGIEFRRGTNRVSIRGDGASAIHISRSGPINEELRLPFTVRDPNRFGPRGNHIVLALLGYEGPQADGLVTMYGQICEQIGVTPLAFAPIRTSPRRTYDPVSFEPEPEGSHVPMFMANLARDPRPEKWAALQLEIEEFGNASGLFQKIEVVQKGKKESDPFQIAVRSEGVMRNLVDVGYGVSQVLPLIVDILSRAKRYDRFLIQQPEVHLHPKAQAELGSFFAQKVRQKMKFMVETHSDHLTDRIRMEVRKGTIAASDVSIVYFENGKKGGRIYNIEIDDEGNILDSPPSYRQFFMTEERALLGI